MKRRREGSGRGFRITEHARDAERDAADEIAFHLEMRERELMGEGMEPGEARRRAREAFGDAGRVEAVLRAIEEEWSPRERIGQWVATVAEDLRFGMRGLRRSPGFAAAAVATLALGMGANAAIFGLVEAVLLRAPAVKDPETLVAVYTTCRRGDPRCASSYPDMLDYDERTTRLSSLAAYEGAALTLADGGTAEIVSGELTTGGYFDVLGLTASRGRLLQAGDDAPGGDHSVAVLSDGFWRRRFGGDPAMVGSAIRLNGVAYQVVGIAPAGFDGLVLGSKPDLWVPLHGLPALFPSWDASAFDERDVRWLSGLVGRLAPGATIEQARAELLAVSAQLAQEDPDARGPRSVTMDPLPRRVLPVGDERFVASFLVVLQVVVGLTLLLACANLANLLLARATARRAEVGVRLAMGVGRPRLVRQMLTESLVLAGLGGAFGIAVAAAGLRLGAGIRMPWGFALADVGAGIDGSVLLFTAALSLVTGVLFGAAPALAAASVQATDLLRESRGTPRSSLRARSALVMLQLAVCVILVVGATGFVRSLRERLRTDLNFVPAGLATLTLDPSMTGYTPERLATLVPALIERAAALPDVRSAAAGTRVPIRRGGGSGFFVTVPGYEPAADEELRIERGLVSAGWFRTVGLPIVRGREFTEAEDRAGERVAVINEVMAEQWWRGRDPLGATFSLRGEDLTIVGIAANTAWSGLEVGADPFVYVPTGSAPESILSASLTLIVKTDGDAARVMTGLRAALADVDPGIAPQRITTLESELRDMLAPQRTTAGLLLGFAALAVLLAVIGVYGVVGYTVSLRGRDLGIRMALGATRAQVSRMVVTGIAPAALLGLGAGTLAAAALARTLESTVPDLAGIRLPAFVFAVPLLALVAALAAWLPARRAARTDPALAVRAE